LHLPTRQSGIRIASELAALFFLAEEEERVQRGQERKEGGKPPPPLQRPPASPRPPPPPPPPDLTPEQTAQHSTAQQLKHDAFDESPARGAHPDGLHPRAIQDGKQQQISRSPPLPSLTRSIPAGLANPRLSGLPRSFPDPFSSTMDRSFRC
jgi:hypothetical protein